MAAVIGGKGACLKAGLKCKRALDRQYHRYGFHCHTGRLVHSKPKPPAVFERKVDVGGFRLAISCLERAVRLSSSRAGPVGGQRLVSPPAQGREDDTRLLLRPGRARGQRRPPTSGTGTGREGCRGAASPVGGSRHLPALRLRRWSWRLLQSLVREALSRRSAGSCRGGRNADRSSGGAFSEPSRPAPHRSRRGARPARLLLPGGRRRGTRCRAGSGHAAARPPDPRKRAARSPADFEAQWLKWQKQVARLSTSSILVRAENAGHGIQLGRSGPDRRGVPPINRCRSYWCPPPGLPRDASSQLGGTCLDPTSP